MTTGPLQCNNDESVEFLRRLYPEGPWVLTSVQLDRKGIETRTFRPDTEAAMRDWLTRYGGVRNIYFSLNPPLRDMNKKADREEIKCVAYLHVDVDPRAGEDIPAEQERIRALFEERLPKGVPAPTAVIFSGGGYQGLWALTDPIPIDGNLEKAEDAKRYNQQLELLFGGDNCHNIDRILRLPGTVNLPDAKKIKKGRTPALAHCEFFADVGNREYDLSLFTPAPMVQMRSDIGFSGGGQQVNIKTGNIERIQDVSELDAWNVPDRVKVIIVQGKHPEEPKQGDNSRSAWVFDCVCQLVRCEVPDDVIFSILTDPDFGISESVLEMKSNAEKYAIRQIERAKEEAIDPVLREFNERYAVIGNWGGKCRIVEDQYDEALKRPRLTKQSFEDFRNRHMNRYVVVGQDKDGKDVKAPAGKWWLAHPGRRQYERVIFLPGQEVKGVYNMWKGFACTARPGDCELYLRHLFDNICGGNQEHYEFLLGWMARVVQHPATTGECTIVLRGGRGSGKGFFVKEFGKLFGRHFLQVANSNHLVGQFNSHLRDVVVLFADEAFFAGDKKHESVLKTIVTEDTLPIEAKGVDLEVAPNYIHLIMASNDDHVVPAGGDERRFFVLDVGSEQQQNVSYFKKISAQMDNGGREALLQYLMTYDLSGFEVRNVPKTAALREQQKRTLGQEAEWWYNKLREGRVLGEHENWEDEVRKDAVLDDYLNYARRLSYTRRGNSTSLGLFLQKHCPELATFQRMAEWDEPGADGYTRTIKRRTYFYKLPTLAEAREQWNKLYGPENWPEILVQQAVAEVPRKPVPLVEEPRPITHTAPVAPPSGAPGDDCPF